MQLHEPITIFGVMRSSGAAGFGTARRDTGRAACGLPVLRKRGSVALCRKKSRERYPVTQGDDFDRDDFPGTPEKAVVNLRVYAEGIGPCPDSACRQLRQPNDPKDTNDQMSHNQGRPDCDRS
jgi:hypothetical protein